jgi:hypothetical protein
MANKLTIGKPIDWLLAFVALVAIVSGGRVVGRCEGTEQPSLPPPAKRKIVFRRDIEPILRDRCVSCHGPDKEMGGLRLDNRTDALKGGTSGPVIRPGNSAESKLIWSVAGVGKVPVMPFDGKRLTAEEVGMLRAWIDQGAQWPDGSITNLSADGK